MIRFLALMAAMATFWAMPAQAQIGDEPITGFENPEFLAFLESDFMGRMRRETIQRSMVLHFPECLEAPQFEITESWPILSVEMAQGALTPTNGMWRERLTSTACEETETENMVHTFTQEGQRTFLLVRGTTEADLATQLSLVGEAREIAATHEYARGCDIVRFTDTSVRNRYGETRWGERWVADTCGRRVRLDIVFDSITASETTFTISLVD